MRHIIPISGKDSLATALVQKAIDDSLDYEYVFNPTGLELPEVFKWLEKIEHYLGRKIVKVGLPLKDIIEANNYFLPSQQSRYCTRQSKIEPFTKWIGQDVCTVYYGIRADEPDRKGFNNSTSKNIIPEYTLKKLGIDLKGVYSILNAKGLKPPTFFWPDLYEKVKLKLGFDPKPLIDEWIFDVLFAWRSRANCDRCFNQRYYEWVGLLTFYPQLFWDAERMEKLGSELFSRDNINELSLQLNLFSAEVLEMLRNDEKEGLFTWSSNGKTLEVIAKSAKKIFNDRADKVAKIIVKLLESNLFEDQPETMDILAVTSCGLFCGK